MEAFTKAFGVTKKSLGLISEEASGHFYFVSDNKGKDVVLLVLPVSKDPQGRKAVSQGRKLLKSYRDEHGVKPLYSHGTVHQEGSLVFEIAKGTAKPSIMKIGFKKSTSLHEGVGPKKSMLIGAKIRMAGQSSGGSEDTASSDGADSSERQAALEKWRKDNARLIAEIGGMSEKDIVELFEAEAAFTAHRSSLRSPKSESVELELLAERNASALDALEEKGAALLAQIAAGDTEGARAAEAELDAARVALAAENADGPLFTGDELDAVVRELFSAARNQACAVLLSRLAAIRAEIAAERARVRALPSDVAPEDTERALEAFVQARRDELADIETQLARLSAAP